MTKIIQSLFAEFIRKYMLPLIKLREEERVKYPLKVSIYENIQTCFYLMTTQDPKRQKKSEGFFFFLRSGICWQHVKTKECRVTWIAMLGTPGLFSVYMYLN